MALTLGLNLGLVNGEIIALIPDPDNLVVGTDNVVVGTDNVVVG